MRMRGCTLGEREDHRSRTLVDDAGVEPVEGDAQLERPVACPRRDHRRDTCRAGRRRNRRLQDVPRTHVPMRHGRNNAARTVRLPPLGDWCIGNTTVSKTVTPGSIPGSPACRRPRRSSRPRRSPGAWRSSPAAGRTSASRRRSSSPRPGRRWSSPGAARRCSTRRRRRSASAARWSPATSASPRTRRGSSRPRVERHGRLDVLVNNAGGQYFVPAEEIAREGLARGDAAERRGDDDDDARRGRRRLRRATAGRSST